MMLSREAITSLIYSGELRITPEDSYSVRENGIDLAIGKQYCVLQDTPQLLDTSKEYLFPEDFYNCMEAKEDEGIIIPARGRVLLHTEGYVQFPSNVAGLVELRSTYARLGLSLPPTVVDSGFKGQITIEVIGSSFPIMVHPGEKIVHLVLYYLDRRTNYPYQGTYQGQTGVRLPKMFKPLEG